MSTLMSWVLGCCLEVSLFLWMFVMARFVAHLERRLHLHKLPLLWMLIGPLILLCHFLWSGIISWCCWVYHSKYLHTSLPFVCIFWALAGLPAWRAYSTWSTFSCGMLLWYPSSSGRCWASLPGVIVYLYCPRVAGYIHDRHLLRNTFGKNYCTCMCAENACCMLEAGIFACLG